MTINSLGKLGKGYLLAELCYALWITTGSIMRATQFLITNGIKHPRSKEAPSRMGVWWAATHSESYKLYIHRRELGEIQQENPTDEEFHAAQKIMEELLPAQKQRVADLIVKYHQYPWQE